MLSQLDPNALPAGGATHAAQRGERMELRQKVIVITGAAGGIGAAMARRFAAEQPEGLVLSDRPGTALAPVIADTEAAGCATLNVTADVTAEAEVQALTSAALDRFGRVDLFCSNAGVATGGLLDAPDQDWARAWAVNAMAHVYAARAVLPSMLGRGSGYLLQTCSAAGLLVEVGDVPYTLTKHAAVAFGEWLAITYGGQGIGVSVLCPQGVRTPMLMGGMEAGMLGPKIIAAAGNIIEPQQVAGTVVDGLRDERFLILPHPEVAEFWRRKAENPDRWLGGMRRLVRTVTSGP
jgi:NAD(P)-dependent dehydrogenase (short-subunit alcohol dehydrogenase family)